LAAGYYKVDGFQGLISELILKESCFSPPPWKKSWLPTPDFADSLLASSNRKSKVNNEL